MPNETELERKRMTKEQLAKQLNGREYMHEMLPHEELFAKNDNLLVIFGASDDLCEFRGAFNDEAGCYDGGTVFFTNDGILRSHDCGCEYCGYEEKKRYAYRVNALWCEEDPYSWTFKTKLPHATFDIMEDGEKYCRGIVIDLKEALTAFEAFKQGKKEK